MQQQVFISYAREDVQQARRLRNDLKSAGLQTWFDEDNLLPGKLWRTEITEAIRNSRYFIALLSGNSVEKRGYVQKELKEALDVLDEFPENEVFLVPARLDECVPTYARLKDLHRVDLFPNWADGMKRILLTMEIASGVADEAASQLTGHPRDRTFHVSAVWTQDGLEITGGNIVIAGTDSMRLLRVFVDWIPSFVEREASEHGTEDAHERAFVTGTIRAFHDVFEAVPSEAEMKRGSSVLSRKMNLFYSFARNMYLKAKSRGIDPKEYLFEERTHSLESDGTIGPDDKRNFYRMLLHTYISRVCDVNLDQVEKIESAMRTAGTPPWEDLVEGVYDIDEDKVLRMCHAVKEQHPSESDDQIVSSIMAHIVSACAVEEFPFAEAEKTAVQSAPPAKRTRTAKSTLTKKP